MNQSPRFFWWVVYVLIGFLSLGFANSTELMNCKWLELGVVCGCGGVAGE